MQSNDYQNNDYIEANRRAWNQVAPIHAAANQAKLVQSFTQSGFSVLDSYEMEKLLQIGVKGKAVAQLACNNGRELLSIKNMGAGRCVGFDIAEEFIKQAEELNQGVSSCVCKQMALRGLIGVLLGPTRFGWSLVVKSEIGDAVQPRSSLPGLSHGVSSSP